MRADKHIRPNPTNDTWSSRRAKSFYNEDSDPLGRASVTAQVKWDTFGTKDIQDADTATHAWIAGQVGHLTLGAVGTLIFCWICFSLIPAGPWQITGFLASAVGWLGIWIFKEWKDLKDTTARKGNVFELDSSDILWSAVTAVFYIATGVLLALTVFLGISFSISLTGKSLPIWLVWLALFLPLVLALFVLYLPTVRIAYWWLRWKLNFQQAGLPFFYRLANFKSKIEPDTRVADIVSISNVTNKKIRFRDVVFRPDQEVEPSLKPSHLVIAGPIGSGKTSLVVGIGTEFALSLQIVRYLTAVKLLQLLESKPEPRVMEKDGGRLLWPWRDSDLLIIDDLDEGRSSNSEEPGYAISYVAPDAFKIAVMQRTQNEGLPWLRKVRSVWVVGDVSRIDAWITLSPTSFMEKIISRINTSRP
jgi:hypothetical protein